MNNNRKNNRPNSRPGGSRPGSRPGGGSRPGSRPGGGSRPGSRYDNRPGNNRPDNRPDNRFDKRPGSRPDNRPDNRFDKRPGSRPDNRFDKRSDNRPDNRFDKRPGSRPDNRFDKRPGSRPDNRPDNRFDKRPDSRPDNRFDKRPDSRPDNRFDKRPGSRPDNRFDKRPDSRPDNRFDKRPGSRPDNRPDNRFDKRPGSRPDSRPDNRFDKRPGSRPDSRPDNRFDKRPDNRPDNRFDKRPDSRPDNRFDKRPGSRPDNRFDKRPGSRPGNMRSDNTRPYKRQDVRPVDKRSDRRPQDNRCSARQIVLRILADFDSHPGDPERLADKALARRRLEHRDRRFVFELVYGVLRNRIYLDYVIDKFIDKERGLQPGPLRRILQVGAYQILFLDRVPDHAAVNESVDIAKADRLTASAAGLVNAILRNVIKNKFEIALPDPEADLEERLSVEFSHPRWMIERWLRRYGLSNTKKILAFNNERPDVYLRRGRTSEFSRQQFEADVRTLCDQGGGYLGLYYKMKVGLDPENLRLLKSGLCAVQAPSSGWAVAMMGLSPGDRVADLCAAPGGKTTLITEIVGETGTVVACDKSRFRMNMLAETVDAAGLKNVYSIVCDSARPPFNCRFDKVLLDAPCTGSGVLQRHPDGRFVRTPEDVGNMRELQRQLLVGAAAIVGDGGVLVYSTCSLEPEENEEQAEWFLANHPEFKPETPPDVVPAMYVDNNNCLRVTPFEHGMDGMFAARFRKDGAA